MTPAALAIIGGTIVVSSFISGVFGMAGGMVLLGVLLVYFDVATGMVLFSIIQLTANGWRALHWRQFVRWPIFYWYVAGALLAFIGSLEEFILTFVVGMPKIQTLPMLLWAYLGGRSSIQTYAAVVSLALLAPTLIVLFIAERVLKQEHLAAGFGKA